MDIRRQPKETLKQLVRDYLANQVLLSTQVPHDLVGMVFLPLMMGGLFYPVPKPETPDHPTEPAKGPPRPKRPQPELAAVKPRLEAALEQARETMVKTEFKARWGESVPREVHEAREAFKHAEDDLANAVLVANRAADEVYAAAVAVHRETLKAHRETLKAHREAVTKWGEECLALQPLVDEWEVGKAAYDDKIKADLGVIYGYHKDAIGPRAINGFPMLSECFLLHREDWDLVRAAINRELEHQKEINL